MTWDITDRFPNWGESGESPQDGFFYEGGDQVNEKHLDYLWNSVKGLEDDVQSALNDIDSDGDGIVDKADSVVGGTGNEYTDSDAVSAVDGEVDNASNTVAGLDDTVAGLDGAVDGKSDKGHDHTEGDENKIPDSGLQENYVTNDSNTQVGNVVSSGSLGLDGQTAVIYRDLSIRRDEINNTVLVKYDDDSAGGATLYEAPYNSNKTYTVSFGVESDNSVPYKVIEI